MKRIKSRLAEGFVNMPMMGKLFLLLFVAGILPNVFLAVYSYSQTNRILMENAYENMAMDNRQIGGRIESRLKSYEQVSSLLYTDTRLRNYLITNYRQDYDFVTAYRHINDTFYSLLAANSSLSGITIFIPNESMPEDGKFIQHIRAGDSRVDWLLGSENSHGNILYRETYISSKGERVFSLGRMLNYNNQSFPYGYLVIEIEESSLHAETTGWKQAQVYIANENGVIMTSSDHSMSGVGLHDVLGEAFLTNGQQRGHTIFIREYGKVIAATTTQNGWNIVRVVAISDILDGVDATIRQIVLISTICFAVTFILILAISRYFSGRVHLLNRQIRMIEEKNLRYQEELPGFDEMSQLSAAINRMARKLDTAVNDAHEKEIQTKKVQLTLLQSQINPHFLYNTLSGISALAMRESNDAVSKQLNHLSQFYKISLNQGREYITIGEEITLTEHYLALQEMRFPGLFQVSWDIAEDLMEAKTLKLLLQPFAENIVHHAQRENSSSINVNISVKHSDEAVLFTLSDDGAGIPPERLKSIMTDSSSAGYGIWNVDARIKLAYGEQYGVSITSTFDIGTDITIQIPFIIHI